MTVAIIALRRDGLVTQKVNESLDDEYRAQ